MIILTIIIIQIPYSLRTISDLEKAVRQKYNYATYIIINKRTIFSTASRQAGLTTMLHDCIQSNCCVIVFSQSHLYKTSLILYLYILNLPWLSRLSLSAWLSQQDVYSVSLSISPVSLAVTYQRCPYPQHQAI